MFLVGLISWWYGRGWVEQWRRQGSVIVRTLEFFSVGQLLSTLFSPFRQISAGTYSSGGVRAAVGGFFDRLISRAIGSIIRLFTILIGVVVIMFQSLYSVVIMLVWWVVPVLPFIGLAAYLLGWGLYE